MTFNLIRKSIFLFGLILISLGLLFGCERPDPKGSDVQIPTDTATPMSTPTTLPTQSIVQVYVVVATPTPVPFQTAESRRPVSMMIDKTDKSAILVDLHQNSAAKVEPTPIPTDYFQGWAWSDSLQDYRGGVRVEVGGLTLRDRPSQDGRVVGVVFGLANVTVVGREMCDYTPILVYTDNLITKTTPHPEVLPPEPLPTEPPLFTPVPIPTARFTDGWAYTDELTILGQTAISGPLGINLRSHPCRAAINLGFIPAGSDLIVTGPPGIEYTAVQVSNEILQPPFEAADLTPPIEN